ncbi:MAG: sialidase family protein [candidate division WOR-3 bacterium]
MRSGVLMSTIILTASALNAGYVDTIGGSTYDCSTICAGLQRFIYAVPGRGVHAAWWWAADTYPWPDRNSRYNFYDANGGIWQWIDEDYMLSGINPHSQHTSYGTLDYDPLSAQPVISFHTGSPVRPVVGRGTTAGPGNFQFCQAPVGYQWPWVAVTASGTVHLAMIDNESQDRLWYTQTTDFQNWTPPVNIASPAPDPMFPDHQLIASKQSNRVAVLWIDYEGTQYMELYLRQSTDDGVTWNTPVEIPPPPAFGGDTVTSFHISSVGSLYDRNDNLCLVAAVAPIANGSMDVTPAEIWFYCPTNLPQWSEVHRVDVPAASLRHSIGYNSIIACRPKVGQNPATGELYVIWSEYDTANVERITQLLRPDIWVTSSSDNGLTWTVPTRLTGPDERGRLYVDLAPLVNDTLHLIWMEDLCVGMNVMGQGPATRNPIVYLQLPADEIGLSERQPASAKPTHTVPTLTPRLVALSLHSKRALLIDPVGRVVARLKAGSTDIRLLESGVYFLHASGSARPEKIILQR